jgi:hypothetical protein
VKILPMAILTAALGLAACQGGEKGGAQGGDPNAGLDVAIRSWHAELKTNDPQCKGKPDGEQCRAFEVACKGLREVSPEEAAGGMSAKIGAAIGWEAWDSARSEYRPTSATAEFQKVGGEWKRLSTGPVNLSTCVAS